MNKKEALEWVQGTRSYEDHLAHPLNLETMALIAEADAASCQQAYWVLRAHAERLVPDATEVKE